METLLSAYQSADKSSQQVLETATQILFETSDPEKVAQANRAIKLSNQRVNDAFLSIVEAKSDNLTDVMIKLQLWYEGIVGEDTQRANLSPMEQLLCSVFDDVLQLSKATVMRNNHSVN